MQFQSTIRSHLRKEFSDFPHWKGFIYWWLSALGYDHTSQPNQVKFVDGAHDGGIDVVALPLEDRAIDSIFVVQSKFFGSSPSGKDLRQFFVAVDAIQGTHAEFLDWLDRCRPELHPLYRRLREASGRCRFVLIAPAHVDASLAYQLKQRGIEIHDIEILRRLERSYREGRTPRMDAIRLEGASKPVRVAQSKETNLWVFTVPVRELGRAFERHGNTLFAGNIRYALSGGTARRVREGIDQTLASAPHEFVYSHNGITISGERLRRQQGKITMTSASIVNGAQTVSYLGMPRVMRFLNRNPARITVKFVEVKTVGLLEDVESKVACRSNNQNKVDPSDLMIDLPSLVSLQRHFRRNGVHLERKKGEARIQYGQLRIPKERLAQVLAAAESSEGAVAGKRKQELFEKMAERLFSEFDASDEARSEALGWTWTDYLMAAAARTFENTSRRKRAQLAHLAALSTAHKVFKSLGIKKPVLRKLARYEDQSWEFDAFIERSFKVILAALLRKSAQQKRNEPAFYKSTMAVMPAVAFAVRSCRSKVRRYHRAFLAAM